MIAGATYAPLRCMPWLKYSKVVSGWWLMVRIFVGKWAVGSRKDPVKVWGMGSAKVGG